jgi:[ribosomal protein S18]-alanine N-acetyltransferase
MIDTDTKFLILDSFTGQHLLYTNERIARFLFEHLDEYGDKKEDILKCLDYVFGKQEGKGGRIILALDGEEIVGAVVLNETGMGGYIPENILVYIAIHRDFRGKGLGGQLMDKAIHHSKGAIALHVEPDNPAKKLYERKGFTNKYLEMRLSR